MYETQGSEASYTYLGPSLPRNSLNRVTQDLFGVSLYTTLCSRGTSLGSHWKSQGGSLYVWSPLLWQVSRHAELNRHGERSLPAPVLVAPPFQQRQSCVWSEYRPDGYTKWKNLKILGQFEIPPFPVDHTPENQAMGAPWVVDLY